MEIKDNRDVQEAVVEDVLLKVEEVQLATDARKVSGAGVQSKPGDDLDSNEAEVEAVEAIPDASFGDGCVWKIGGVVL